MLLISPRFAYLIAGLCALYPAVALFLSRWRGPVSYLTLGFWIGAVFLLMAVMLSPKQSRILALLGSTLTTALLFYGMARFVAFRLGYIHGKVQIGAYQPDAFDRVNQIVSRSILVLFLISSVASLVISALITFSRNRAGAPPPTESSGD